MQCQQYTIHDNIELKTALLGFLVQFDPEPLTKNQNQNNNETNKVAQNEQDTQNELNRFVDTLEKESAQQSHHYMILIHTTELGYASSTRYGNYSLIKVHYFKE